MSTSPLKIAGVILAGGKSSRMGCDKSHLKYHGVSLIDRMAHLLSSVKLPVWISGKNDGPFCIPDKMLHAGPLSGMISSVVMLQKQKYEGAVFIPVDMPMLTSDVILQLMHCSKNKNVDAVCFQKTPLPLLVYFTEHVNNTLCSIEKIMARGISIKYFLNSISVFTLEEKNDFLFTNINTPSELIQFTIGCSGTSS